MDMLAVNNFGDTRSGGLAGPMGLFVIVLLCIATVLLIRNMNRRLRRLPDSFPDVKQTEREAEIARLNSDLERSEAGGPASDVDEGRSTRPGSAPDSEVTGGNTESDERPANGDPGRV